VTRYASTYSATNVVQSELREHLARADKYTLDSLSRRVAFDHNAPSPTAPAAASRLSTWQLDGVHSWRAYTRRGESLAPVVDLAGGVNEYQSFGGATQLHDANGGGTKGWPPPLHLRLRESAGRRGGPPGHPDRQLHLRRPQPPGPEADGDRDHPLPLPRLGVYRGWEVLEERTVLSPTQDLPARQYVYREGVDRPVQLQTLTGPGAGTYYYHLDPRGSVGALTTATGGTLYHAEYDACGDGVDGSPRLDPATATPLAAPGPTGNRTCGSPGAWTPRPASTTTAIATTTPSRAGQILAGGSEGHVV
jgi:hypothetical protein